MIQTPSEVITRLLQYVTFSEVNFNRSLLVGRSKIDSCHHVWSYVIHEPRFSVDLCQKLLYNFWLTYVFIVVSQTSVVYKTNCRIWDFLLTPQSFGEGSTVETLEPILKWENSTVTSIIVMSGKFYATKLINYFNNYCDI